MSESTTDPGATWSNATLTMDARGRARIDGRNDGEWIAAHPDDLLNQWNQR